MLLIPNDLSTGVGEDHSEDYSCDSDYVPTSESESDSNSDNSDNSEETNNSGNDNDSDGNVEETLEDVDRAADILHEEEAGNDIPTEPSTLTSREDDCCVDYQSASDHDSKDLPSRPARTLKATGIYNPMTGKSYVQNIKPT